jgi:nickel/cobalt transporter (NicO) family protein
MISFEYMLAPLLIGFAHSVEADHVVAVGNLVNVRENWQKECMRGFSWGIGHTTSVMIAALAIMYFKSLFTTPTSFSFEIFVGIMMLIIGVVKLYQLGKHVGHSHSDNSIFLFFNVGLVHGLAGSGGIAALLSSQTSDLVYQVQYILVFGLGTILGMGLIATVISRIGQINAQFSGVFSVLIACFSIFYGSKIIYQQLF